MTRIRLIALSAALIFGCSACAAGPTTAPSASGLLITAVVDRGCPHLSVGAHCPTTPIVAHLLVTAATTGAQVAQADSSETAAVRVDLPPGSYLVAGTVSGVRPTARPVPVTVVSGRHTPVVVVFDSGVRGAMPG